MAFSDLATAGCGWSDTPKLSVFSLSEFSDAETLLPPYRGEDFSGNFGQGTTSQ